MDIIRTRQKNWIGHIRGLFLSLSPSRGWKGREEEEGLDKSSWMMEDGHWRLKDKAQHREDIFISSKISHDLF